MSDTLFVIAIVVVGTLVVGWGMTRPSGEPGDNSWSDSDDGGDSDGD